MHSSAGRSDTITKCKKRCPTGEDPECPGDETCFAYTGCRAELGYGDDPSNWVPGYDQWGYILTVPFVPPDDSQELDCKATVVTITADNWPKEITWGISDRITGEEVVSGGDLKIGATAEWEHCLGERKGCLVFTIFDSSGDGICCNHGEGSYVLEYDGKRIREGGAFYDYESTDFACAEDEIEEKNPPITDSGSDEDETPEKSPSSTDSGPDEDETPERSPSSTGSGFRCVPLSLANGGYKVSSSLCGRFTDCYNVYIGVGDSFFCNEGEACLESEECSSGQDESAQVEVTPSKSRGPSMVTTSARPSSVAPKPTTNKPTIPADKNDTPSPDDEDEPFQGTCSGKPCRIKSYCRTRIGFCGPGKTYCNSDAVWTSDCPIISPMTPPPSIRPTVSPMTLSPTVEPTISDVTLSPTITPFSQGAAVNAIPVPTESSKSALTKPSGGGKIKPTGGKVKPEAAKPSPLIAPQGSNALDTFIIEDPSSKQTPRPIMSQSTEPTPTRPTQRPSSRPVKKVEENEYSCTGLPCEEKAWCRSRYGSCGPGFIYCNSYSMWREGCPRAPTNPPSPRPTRRPYSYFDRPPKTPTPGNAGYERPPSSQAGYGRPPSSQTVASSNGAVTSPGNQMHSALPKPTLPEITPDMASHFGVSIVITEADSRDPQPSSEDNAPKDAAVKKKQPIADYTMSGVQEWLDFASTSTANQTNYNMLQSIITSMFAFLLIQTQH